MGRDTIYVLGLECLVVFFLPNAPKQIHKFSAVPANIPTGFLTMILVKLIITFIWWSYCTRIAKIIFRK